MTEKQKKILETFNRLLPNLNTLEQEKLLSFGEGLAFAVSQQPQQTRSGERREGA